MIWLATRPWTQTTSDSPGRPARDSISRKLTLANPKSSWMFQTVLLDRSYPTLGDEKSSTQSTVSATQAWKERDKQSAPNLCGPAYVKTFPDGHASVKTANAQRSSDILFLQSASSQFQKNASNIGMLILLPFLCPTATVIYLQPSTDSLDGLWPYQ